ncbi:MAG: hypothetical protein Q4C53_06700 [Clostridia bacterium]|nr:hypothetical protein [Clostridia bacterium]
MWIRVALAKSAVHYRTPVGLSFIDGAESEEYYFDERIAAELEADGFLREMWKKRMRCSIGGIVTFFCPIVV